MKKTILILICLMSTATVFAQKTNFSGNWAIDYSRTDFGQAPKYIIPKSINVTQTANQLVLIRVLLNNDLSEKPPVTETLSFDGTPFKWKSGDADVATSVTWPNDQSLSLTRQSSAKATETWSLEDDGKTLVIDRAVEQADNFKYTIKCYYNKQ